MEIISNCRPEGTTPLRRGRNTATLLCGILIPIAVLPRLLCASGARRSHDIRTQAVVELLSVGEGTNGTTRVCSGTGFVINPSGDVLTNAHVVQTLRKCMQANGESRILARFHGETSVMAEAVRCRVESLDEVSDLAVLRLEDLPRGVTYARLDSHMPRLGTDVLVVGHTGQAWKVQTSSGRILKEGKRRAPGNRQVDVLLLNIPLRTGASGSPVFGVYGVVGIIESRDSLNPPVAVAISIRDAIQWLDRYHIRWYGADDSN